MKSRADQISRQESGSTLPVPGFVLICPATAGFVVSSGSTQISTNQHTAKPAINTTQSPHLQPDTTANTQKTQISSTHRTSCPFVALRGSKSNRPSRIPPPQLCCINTHAHSAHTKTPTNTHKHPQTPTNTQRTPTTNTNPPPHQQPHPRTNT